MDYWVKAVNLPIWITLCSGITSQFLATMPKEFCRHIPDRGPCWDSMTRWYYDVPADNCTLFTYGGCLGNRNNFETFAHCEKTCRRTYNPATYIFAKNGGGANEIDDGSQKNFNLASNGNTDVSFLAPTNDCDQPVQRGFCSSFIPRWHYYNGTSCELFYYSGCGGNGNNFLTLEYCQDRCLLPRKASLQPGEDKVTQSPPSETTCLLKPERGACTGALIRWYYDYASQGCLEFIYTGCAGNDNNYGSRRECEHQCMRDQKLIISNGQHSGGPYSRQDANGLYPGVDLEQGPDQAADAPVAPSKVILRDNSVTSNSDESSNAARCFFDFDVGPCNMDVERWYFDHKNTKACRPFYYGGCSGNANRFLTQKECETSCARNLSTSEICHLEPSTGSCRAAFSRYYFDVNARQCKPFTYGGCDGNANNFLTIGECDAKCVTSVVYAPVTDLNRIEQKPNFLRSVRPARCNQLSDTGPCRAAISKWFFNGRFCERFVYGGCNGNDNRFESSTECQDVCGGDPTPAINLFDEKSGGSGSSRPLDNVCVLAPDSGPCDAAIPRYFNDPSAGVCRPFTYGGCAGNLNNFPSSSDCERSCRSKSVTADRNHTLPFICTIPAERGPCLAFLPAFFHDIRDGKCKMFYFGGCQGNGNRFSSREECLNVCNPGRSTADSINQIPRLDWQSQNAKPSLIPKKNICEQPPSTGNCLAIIPSYFYDAQAGECRTFIYDGCGGSRNRFETKNECEKTCHPMPMTRSILPQAIADTPKSRKNTDCLLPTKTGPCRGSFRVFGFDGQKEDCIEFTYGGCNGNGNRFLSRADCLQECGGLISSDKNNMMQFIRQRSK